MTMLAKMFWVNIHRTPSTSALTDDNVSWAAEPDWLTVPSREQTATTSLHQHLVWTHWRWRSWSKLPQAWKEAGILRLRSLWEHCVKSVITWFWFYFILIRQWLMIRSVESDYVMEVHLGLRLFEGAAGNSRCCNYPGRNCGICGVGQIIRAAPWKTYAWRGSSWTVTVVPAYPFGPQQSCSG